MSHSIARMELSRKSFPSNNFNMLNRIDIAKMEARMEMDLRIAKKVHDLEQFRNRIHRKKEPTTSGLIIASQMALVCIYFAAVFRFA